MENKYLKLALVLLIASIPVSFLKANESQPQKSELAIDRCDLGQGGGYFLVKYDFDLKRTSVTVEQYLSGDSEGQPSRVYQGAMIQKNDAYFGAKLLVVEASEELSDSIGEVFLLSVETEGEKGLNMTQFESQDKIWNNKGTFENLKIISSKVDCVSQS